MAKRDVVLCCPVRTAKGLLKPEIVLVNQALALEVI